MTVGQAAGRSGRDSQHVALSSRAALSPGVFSDLLSQIAKPGKLIEGLLDMLEFEFPGTISGGLLEGALRQAVDNARASRGDSQE